MRTHADYLMRCLASVERKAEAARAAGFTDMAEAYDRMAARYLAERATTTPPVVRTHADYLAECAMVAEDKADAALAAGDDRTALVCERQAARHRRALVTRTPAELAMADSCPVD